MAPAIRKIGGVMKRFIVGVDEVAEGVADSGQLDVAHARVEREHEIDPAVRERQGIGRGTIDHQRERHAGDLAPRNQSDVLG